MPAPGPSVDPPAAAPTVNTMDTPPFNHPSADVILQSSDLTNFRVHKIILSLASPVFADMFSVPQPRTARSGETFDGLPVVQVSEDARTLAYALRSMYPAERVRLESLDAARALLEVGRKYCMQAVVAAASKDTLSVASSRYPGGVFALALAYDMPDIAEGLQLRMPCDFPSATSFLFLTTRTWTPCLQSCIAGFCGTMLNAGRLPVPCPQTTRGSPEICRFLLVRSSQQ
ncbi:hypothetical protein FA95DRAFT_267806 [Auriscalpium vulgare]|uniref:Uncharacterized protein n=1 Tax=Auriscalpium vulgare TaxID=40419 RepID=A0ACB8RJP6_9AGAM|nr:hypothetical protein FA95DRAFT_267806 [Auriscalpium vulgare]